MLEVLEANIRVNSTRIGCVLIKYNGLNLLCEVCLYKDSHLWIRMPERWITQDEKVKYVWWDTQAESESNQAFILSKVFDMIQLDVTKAIALRNEFFVKRKELTNWKNKLTLDEKNPKK